MLEKADKYVKRVIPQAEYMEKFNHGTKVYYLKEEDEEIKKGHEYAYIEIDNKIYGSIWTNTYNKLKEYFKEEFKEDKVTQLQLF